MRIILRNYSEGGSKSREKRMTGQGLLECQQDLQALLAQRREITADAAKDRHPLFGTEAARDLLLNLDHAQIALGEVVIERHGKIVQEAEYGPFALRESIQQVACRALFGSASCSLLGWWRGGISGIAFGEDLVIATQQACQHQHIQFVLTQSFGSLDLGFHV